MEYTIVSSHPHVVCLSMFLALCSISLQSTDLGIRKNNNKKPCGSVWLLVRSSEVAVPFHYAHTPLKTDTRQKIRGDRSCTHVPTWRKHWGTPHTETRALTTLRVSTYSHSHYGDEPNKEMHTILFTLPHVTHTVNTRTNQTDTWLCLNYALNHS